VSKKKTNYDISYSKGYKLGHKLAFSKGYTGENAREFARGFAMKYAQTINNAIEELSSLKVEIDWDAATALKKAMEILGEDEFFKESDLHNDYEMKTIMILRKAGLNVEADAYISKNTRFSRLEMASRYWRKLTGK